MLIPDRRWLNAARSPETIIPMGQRPVMHKHSKWTNQMGPFIGDTAWICCRSTWTRVALPMKSSNTQTRASLAICSTVAMKLANGPECISTDWPASKSSRGTTLPTLSQRARRPAISAAGMGLGPSAKLSMRDTP